MSRTCRTLLASALLLAFAACKDDKKQAAPAPPAPEATKPAEGAAPPEAAGPTEARPTEAARPADTAPPAGGEDLDKAGAELLGKLADVLDANKGDCGKLAVELRAFRGANRAVLDKVKGHWAAQTPEQKTAVKDKYETELAAIEKKGEPALKACRKDKDVKAAFDELGID